MTDEEVYSKIKETYNTDKGKNFITHLLRSFIPLNKSSKMFNNDKKLRLRDCITGESLHTLDEHMEILGSEEGMKAFFDNVKASIRVDEKETYKLPESVENIRNKIQPLAVSCEKSDKVISEQTLGQLFNFYATEILNGNKHINWIANNERGKQFIKQGKAKGYIENKKEERVVKKAAERAKLSLGDFDVLRELKAKLDKNES